MLGLKGDFDAFGDVDEMKWLSGADEVALCSYTRPNYNELRSIVNTTFIVTNHKDSLKRSESSSFFPDQFVSR